MYFDTCEDSQYGVILVCTSAQALNFLAYFTCNIGVSPGLTSTSACGLVQAYQNVPRYDIYFAILTSLTCFGTHKHRPLGAFCSEGRTDAHTRMTNILGQIVGDNL